VDSAAPLKGTSYSRLDSERFFAARVPGGVTEVFFPPHPLPSLSPSSSSLPPAGERARAHTHTRTHFQRSRAASHPHGCSAGSREGAALRSPHALRPLPHPPGAPRRVNAAEGGARAQAQYRASPLAAAVTAATNTATVIFTPPEAEAPAAMAIDVSCTLADLKHRMAHVVGLPADEFKIMRGGSAADSALRPRGAVMPRLRRPCFIPHKVLNLLDRTHRA